MEKVDIKAAGLNHFTWMLDIRHKETGEDLYPLFAERWAAFDPELRAADPGALLRLRSAASIPGDEHLWSIHPGSATRSPSRGRSTTSASDWDRNAARRDSGHAWIERMADGVDTVAPCSTLTAKVRLEVIENLTGAGNHYHLAVNLPNQGYITNLPAGAIVEVPGLMSGAGVLGVGRGRAAHRHRRTLSSRTGRGATGRGCRRHRRPPTGVAGAAPRPRHHRPDVARQILDDYLETYRSYLPQFWT
ncbi:MAG: hypothetical protein R2838_17845 [Caldilineaceae bacterium]